MLVTQLCPTLCDPMDCSLPGSSVHGDSPGKNTGVGWHFLLQREAGIYLIYSRQPCAQLETERKGRVDTGGLLAGPPTAGQGLGKHRRKGRAALM